MNDDIQKESWCLDAKDRIGQELSHIALEDQQGLIDKGTDTVANGSQNVTPILLFYGRDYVVD